MEDNLIGVRVLLDIQIYSKKYASFQERAEEVVPILKKELEIQFPGSSITVLGVYEFSAVYFDFLDGIPDPQDIDEADDIVRTSIDWAWGLWRSEMDRTRI